MSIRGRYCESPFPGATSPRCELPFPHPGEEHSDGRDLRWSGSAHGDAGNIIETALRMNGSTLVDRVAISLMVSFGRAEPEDGISRYPASSVATFADMARAIVDQFEITDHTPPPVTPAPDGCGSCGKGRRQHSIEMDAAGRLHNYATPTDEQRLERMRARRRANEERLTSA